MKRFALASLTTVLLLAPGSITAQTVAAEITLKVPINLTQLSPNVPKIYVICSIASPPIVTASNNTVTKYQEVPVSGNQVVTTVTFVFSFTGLDNPVGKQGNLACSVMGWSTSRSTWVDFTTTATDPLFKVSAPMTTAISFTW